MKFLVLLLPKVLLLPQYPTSLICYIVITSFTGNHNLVAESQDENINTNINIMKEDNIISTLTEWTGIFVLGLTLGFVSPLR